ncbi:MAG: tetratricopeptide repeat protein, partial [Calditrichia bacterium]
QAQQAPNDLSAQLQLVRHRIAAGQSGIAKDNLHRLQNHFGNHPLISYELGRVFLQEGNTDSARICFLKTVEKQPRNSGAWYMLGEVYRLHEDYDEALKAFRTALQADPRVYEAYNGMGKVQQARKQYSLALNSYQKSLEILAHQPGIYELMGDSYFESGNYTAAAANYQKGLLNGNTSAVVLNKLASACFLGKDYENARQYILMAVSRDSLNSEIWYNYGNILASRGNFPQAATAYSKAIQLAGNHPDYYNNLALCYREMGNYNKSLQYFSEGLKKHPGSQLLKANLQITRKQSNQKQGRTK